MEPSKAVLVNRTFIQAENILLEVRLGISPWASPLLPGWPYIAEFEHFGLTAAIVRLANIFQPQPVLEQVSLIER